MQKQTWLKSKISLFLLCTLFSGILHAEDEAPYVLVKANDQATISSITNASVTHVYFTEGDKFHTGDILMELDCHDKNSDLKNAQSKLAIANTGYSNAIKLKSYGAISDLELLHSKSQLEMANAEVDKLTSILQGCTIKAPFNGSVAKLMVHDYESVKQGDPLLKLIGSDNVEFVMQVPANWLTWLRVGDRVNVHINEINKTIQANVTGIDPEVDSINQTIKIFAKQVEIDPLVLPGMSGQANFPDRPATTMTSS